MCVLYVLGSFSFTIRYYCRNSKPLEASSELWQTFINRYAFYFELIDKILTCDQVRHSLLGLDHHMMLTWLRTAKCVLYDWLQEISFNILPVINVLHMNFIKIIVMSINIIVIISVGVVVDIRDIIFLFRFVSFKFCRQIMVKSLNFTMYFIYQYLFIRQ